VQISLRILGPLTAELRPAEPGREPIELDPGPLKQRLLLAILLCRCNGMVPVTQLIDVLWWDGPPRTAQKNIQVYVSHLRKLIEADGRGDRLRCRPSGYQLLLSPAELDVLRFEDLSRSGRLALRRGDPASAAAVIRQALDLWRGPALADLLVSPALRAEAARIDERRLAVYEDWFEAELLLGNHGEVLAEIEAVVRDHPLRERLRSQQLTALYRGGRQAEALAEYDNVRQLLATELGLSPSPALRRLYQDILAGSPALSGMSAVVPAGAASLATAGHPAEAALAGPAPPASAGPEVVAHLAVPAEQPPPGPAAMECQPPATGLAAAGRPAGGPSGLPRAPDDFAGRQDLLARLLAFFGDGATDTHLGRFAAITGPPGAGSTALALRIAHTIASRFRDGAMLLQCRDAVGAPRGAAELLDELLARLPAGTEPMPLAAGDPSTVLRGRLAGLRLLLIYDGAADEGQIRPLLPGAGECSVLLTSCRHLGGLEGFSHFPVGAFTEDEALELLCRVAGAQRIAADRPAALRIARACGLLPLAVRIAGARLAGLPHLPLDRFAARLEDESRVLDELAIGDLSVRDRFARYLRALSDAERQALVQVAAAWSPPSAGPGVIEQLLERLACVHALTVTDTALRPEPGPPPFLMPAPLWIYARQLLSAAAGDARP
jgi:DNA-binding SARP family transcriptional activator